MEVFLNKRYDLFENKNELLKTMEGKKTCCKKSHLHFVIRSLSLKFISILPWDDDLILVRVWLSAPTAHAADSQLTMADSQLTMAGSQLTTEDSLLTLLTHIS